jgi:hypothetical protein
LRNSPKSGMVQHGGLAVAAVVASGAEAGVLGVCRRRLVLPGMQFHEDAGVGCEPWSGCVDQLAHVVEPVVATEERLCRLVFPGLPGEQLRGAERHVGRYGDQQRHPPAERWGRRVEQVSVVNACVDRQVAAGELRARGSTSLAWVSTHGTARPTGLAELYAAAEVQLSQTALAAYDDVQAFHDSVIANRRQYLAAEIRRITTDLITIPPSGTASPGSVPMGCGCSPAAAPQKRCWNCNGTSPGVKSVSNNSGTARLYADQQHGRLVINATDNGPEISATIPRGRSKGITNMQVYCFDIDLITLWSRKASGPGFLVHDSHLFDGVDERQRASALQLGAPI